MSRGWCALALAAGAAACTYPAYLDAVITDVEGVTVTAPDGGVLPGVDCVTSIRTARPSPDGGASLLAIPLFGEDAGVSLCERVGMPGGVEYQRYLQTDAGRERVCLVCPWQWADGGGCVLPAARCRFGSRL